MGHPQASTLSSVTSERPRGCPSNTWQGGDLPRVTAWGMTSPTPVAQLDHCIRVGRGAEKAPNLPKRNAGQNVSCIKEIFHRKWGECCRSG